MNSLAPSVTAWRLYRSAISARLVCLREIGSTAFWEFCNTICHEQTRPLFDHLVGAAEQWQRHFDAKRSASRSGKSLTSQLYREQQTFMGAVATP
jgi:hypothetical protein